MNLSSEADTDDDLQNIDLEDFKKKINYDMTDNEQEFD